MELNKGIDDALKNGVAVRLASKTEINEMKKPNGRKESFVSEALRLVEDIGAKAVRNDNNEAFVLLRQSGVLRAYRAQSNDLASLLMVAIRNGLGRCPNSNELKTILFQLKGESLTTSPVAINKRIAMDERGFYYDLGDRVVRITKDGWAVMEDNDHPLFLRMNSQCLPEKNEDIQGFLSLFPNLTEQAKELIPLLLVTSIVPGIPHPIMYVTGNQGSGKSTLARILCDLIDPQGTVNSHIKSTRDLDILASQRWVITSDNISEISRELSDEMCRLVTGGSSFRRALYTDGDLSSVSFRNLLILNGINFDVERPDLLDRTIHLELINFSDVGRQTAGEIEGIFRREKPYLVGAMFHALAKSMASYSIVSSLEKLRLADFGTWAAAASLAIYKDETRAQILLKSNRLNQAYEVLSSDPVFLAIEACVSTEGVLRGTPTELGRILCRFNPDPILLNERKLGRHLNRLEPELRRMGYSYSMQRGKKRMYEIGPIKTS